MARPVSKDAILEAAQAIVSESGAANMTLDAVAERAGVSKGGLMYSFPSKNALLQAMIGRLIEHVEQQREQLRQSLADRNPTTLMLEIKLMAELDEAECCPTAALLAAVANQPELMEPFRDEIRRRIAERAFSGKHPDRSVILYLAALGLHLSALLRVPALEPEQRRKTYANLLRLAADEKAPL